MLDVHLGRLTAYLRLAGFDAVCQYYDEFFRCPGCHRIYWRGGHFDALQRLLEHATTAARAGTDTRHTAGRRMTSEPLPLMVDCYAGSRGEETPD